MYQQHTNGLAMSGQATGPASINHKVVDRRHLMFGTGAGGEQELMGW